MASSHLEPEHLLERLRSLPPERLVEVQDFVDFLVHREERRLVTGASKLAEPSFRKIWDNEDDAIYDDL